MGIPRRSHTGSALAPEHNKESWLCRSSPAASSEKEGRKGEGADKMLAHVNGREIRGQKEESGR